MGEARPDAPDLRPVAPRAEAPPRYRVELLAGVRFEAPGLWCAGEACERLIRWDEIRFATAAEVGEPEGVRAIVFDLVLERDGEGWRAARLDAEPGPGAEEIARRLYEALPARRRGASLKSLARDGVASQWFPDVGGFEEATLVALASGAS
jgi:hypothetical protein